MIRRLRASLSALLTLGGLLLILSPLYWDSIYANFIVAAGVVTLYSLWLIASFINKEKLMKQGRWKQQSKAIIAMTLCMAMGLGLLLYYEKKMPKYQVAMIKKELYRVPPQLNTKELLQLGAECNFEGDTLCAHAVFARVVRKDPRNIKALANLAIAQSHLGFHRYAVENFQTAIRLGERSYDTFLFYGNSLLALKDKRGAIKAYSRSLRKRPDQEKLREKLTSLVKPQ